MVIDKSKLLYVCPYCSCEYDTEYEADSCADECSMEDRMEVETKDLDSYECEYCHEEFNTYNIAADCETDHQTQQDRYWERYNHNQSFKRLLEAGTKPGQKKIMEAVKC